MKTLCIKNWCGFEEGKVYDVVIGPTKMFTYGVNTLTYNVYFSSTIITEFQDDEIFQKCYHKYFSHKLYQRKAKLERICNDF